MYIGRWDPPIALVFLRDVVMQKKKIAQTQPIDPRPLALVVMSLFALTHFPLALLF